MTSCDAIRILQMYHPETYCITLGLEADPLVKQGFLEWVPGPAWAGERTYAITEEGKTFLMEQS